MTDEHPLRPPPEMLPEQTVEGGYYCKAHQVVKMVDHLGRSVCPVCIVLDYTAEALEP